jgi:hypothetical protein
VPSFFFSITVINAYPSLSTTNSNITLLPDGLKVFSQFRLCPSDAMVDTKVCVGVSILFLQV